MSGKEIVEASIATSIEVNLCQCGGRCEPAYGDCCEDCWADRIAQARPRGIQRRVNMRWIRKRRPSAPVESEQVAVDNLFMNLGAVECSIR